MLPGLCSLEQIIAHHFCLSGLVESKNLTNGAQMVRVLFVLQILYSTQVLIHQHG